MSTSRMKDNRRDHWQRAALKKMDTPLRIVIVIYQCMFDERLSSLTGKKHTLLWNKASFKNPVSKLWVRGYVRFDGCNYKENLKVSRNTLYCGTK